MSEEKTVLSLKNETSVNTYLTFLQDVISRMGNNSANVKALISVIFTIVATVFTAINNFQQFWWICLTVSIIGMIMDSYYLALERMYRTKYNNIVKDLNKRILNEEQIFNMNPKNTELKHEIIAEMIESIKSFSVIGFYLLLIAISILIKFL